MTTLEGIARQPGFAVAVAAVVDARLGINGVSHTLLQAGISALRRGSAPDDYPEAILVCDNLILGAAMKIPGVNIIGVAAESDADPPGLPVEVPCVIGVSDLLRSISDEDIVIVDGYKGLIVIDPDPATLVHYQEAEEHRHLRDRVFIASEHIPARTATGETVHVYAHLTDEAQLPTALESGADGLIFDLRGKGDDPSALCAEVLREATGKPVVFLVDMECEGVLRAAMVYCTPGQVTLAAGDADLLAAQVEMALDRIVLEALQLDIEPPQVNLGCVVPAGTDHSCPPAVIDAADDPLEGFALPPNDIEPVVVLRARAEAIAVLVSAGVRRVAVDADRVADAKLMVRSIGLEEEL